MVDRIRAQCPGFLRVGGAADLGAALDGVTTAPACFVVPLAEQVTETQHGPQRVVQTVTVTVGVLLVIKNVQAAAGAPALSGLETLRAAVRACLLGWMPAGAHVACVFAGGELADFQPGLMWWQDGYKTAHHIQSI